MPNNNPPPNLASLPLELRENILAKLVYEDEESCEAVPALKACCLTCKALLGPAQRLLFRTLRIGSRMDAMIPKDVLIGKGYAPPIEISPRISNRVVYRDNTHSVQPGAGTIHIPYPTIRLANVLSSFPLYQAPYVQHLQLDQRGELFLRPSQLWTWDTPKPDKHNQVQELAHDFASCCLLNVRELTLKTPQDEIDLFLTTAASQSGRTPPATFPSVGNPLSNMLAKPIPTFARITHLHLHILNPVDLGFLHGWNFPHLTAIDMRYAWFTDFQLRAWFYAHSAEAEPLPNRRRVLESLKFSSRNPIRVPAIFAFEQEQELRWLCHRLCPLDLTRLERLEVDVYTRKLYGCVAEWIADRGSGALRTLRLDITGDIFDEPRSEPLNLGRLGELQTLDVSFAFTEKNCVSPLFDTWLQSTLHSLPAENKLRCVAVLVETTLAAPAVYDSLRSSIVRCFDNLFYEGSGVAPVASPTGRTSEIEEILVAVEEEKEEEEEGEEEKGEEGEEGEEERQRHRRPLCEKLKHVRLDLSLKGLQSITSASEAVADIKTALRDVCEKFGLDINISGS